MREPDIEGVATHGGPKSCDGVREDGGEALTGVRVGWAIDENREVPRSPAVVMAGRAAQGRPRPQA